MLSIVLIVTMMPVGVFAESQEQGENGESFSSYRDEAQIKFNIDDNLIFESTSSKASDINDDIYMASAAAAKAGENQMAMVYVTRDVNVNTSIFVEKNVVLVGENGQTFDFQGEHTIYVEGSVYGGNYNGENLASNVFAIRGSAYGKNGHIEKTTISYSAKNGIFIPGTSANSYVANNTISYCGENGIKAEDKTIVSRMEYNTIKNNDGNGILVSSGAMIKSMEGNQIYNNKLANIGVNGKTGEETSVTLDSNNKVYSSTESGIRANGKSTIKVLGNGNLIEKNGKNDVELSNDVNFTISGKATINPKSSSQWGLKFANFCKVDISNTTITGTNSVLYDTSCTFSRTNCTITGTIKKEDFVIPTINTLKAKSIDCKTCYVNWQPIAMDNVKYLIYRGTAPTGDWGNAIATSTSPEYTDKTVIVGTKYYYMVRAVIEHDGQKLYSDYSNMDYGYPRLNDVTGFKAWASNSQTTNISWDQVKDKNVEIWVYRGTSPSGDWGSVHAKVTNGASSFTETVSPGKYYYMVRQAVRGNDGQMHFGEYSPVDYAYARVPVPTGFSCWAQDKTTCKVVWNRVSGSNIKYLIYRGLEPTGDWGNAIAVLDSSNSNYIDRNLTTGRKYYYMMRASETINGKTYYSDYTNVDYGYPR